MKFSNNFVSFLVKIFDKYTLYYSEKRRGKDADTEAGVLPAYKGVLVHDNLKSLYHFTCTHAECNAHILRYLYQSPLKGAKRWRGIILSRQGGGRRNSGFPIPTDDNVAHRVRQSRTRGALRAP